MLIKIDSKSLSTYYPNFVSDVKDITNVFEWGIIYRLVGPFRHINFSIRLPEINFSTKLMWCRQSSCTIATNLVVLIDNNLFAQKLAAIGIFCTISHIFDLLI